MTLDTFIAQSIYNYPSLYYTGDIELSKLRVLNHAFLVIGNGLDFKDGYFTYAFVRRLNKTKKKQRMTKKIKERIFNGEPLVTIYEYTQHTEGETGYHRGRNIFDAPHYTAFLADVKQEDYVDYEVAIKLDKLPNTKGVIEKEGSNGAWHPYPFSMAYCAFYDSDKKALMPKDAINEDFRKGIVYIYQKTVEWFEDDEKFLKDAYYNWILSEDSVKRFSEKFNKTTDKEKLCEDYRIPFKNYQTPEEMIQDLIVKSRKQWIDEAKTIIEHYS